jgi:exodeoxyribonuclease VII large subunit
LPYLRQQQLEVERQRQRLTSAMQQKLQHAGEHLGHLAQMLDSLSPLGTLQRGYAIVTDSNGKVVTDSGAVAVGDEVSARLASGVLGLTVKTRGE